MVARALPMQALLMQMQLPKYLPMRVTTLLLVRQMNTQGLQNQMVLRKFRKSFGTTNWLHTQRPTRSRSRKNLKNLRLVWTHVFALKNPITTMAGARLLLQQPLAFVKAVEATRVTYR